MNVKNILTVKGKGVVTIKPDQTIREAILKMKHHNIGSLAACGRDCFAEKRL